MVFRKPYAFLIKHFRLIHLIITGLLVYIVSFSNKIYSFIVDCINDQVNRYNALEFIDYSIYIWIILSMLLFFIIYWLFRYKDKPRNIYMVSILGYLFLGVYFFILFNYFTGLPNNIIDQKMIRAYRDIMFIILGCQYLIIIIMFIRGLGFDIKKFNFTKDMQELNLTHKDDEEVEINVNVDMNNIMRGVRKRKREFGYFFQEYKIIILSILFILLIVSGYFGYKYFSEILKVYKQGENIGYTNNIIIKNSYYNIDDDKNYVIINFDIFKYGRQEKFNVNNMILKVGDNEYLPNKNICYKFDDLGNCYKKQYVNSTSRNYIIVYEIDGFNLKK